MKPAVVAVRRHLERCGACGFWLDVRGVVADHWYRVSGIGQRGWLASDGDAGRWQAEPLSAEELSLAEIADRGVAEDWSDWSDGTR